MGFQKQKEESSRKKSKTFLVINPPGKNLGPFLFSTVGRRERGRTAVPDFPGRGGELNLHLLPSYNGGKLLHRGHMKESRESLEKYSAIPPLSRTFPGRVIFATDPNVVQEESEVENIHLPI